MKNFERVNQKNLNKQNEKFASNSHRSELLKSIVSQFVMLSSVITFYMQDSKSLFSNIVLVANILIFLFSIYIYTSKKNINESGIYRSLGYKSISIFVMLMSTAFIFYSFIKNGNESSILHAILLLAVTLIIAYSIVSFVNKNIKSKNPVTVRLISIIVSFLVFILIAYIVIALLVHFKKI